MTTATDTKVRKPRPRVTNKRNPSTNRSIYLPVALMAKLEAQAAESGRTWNGHVRWLLERAVENGNGKVQ